MTWYIILVIIIVVLAILLLIVLGLYYFQKRYYTDIISNALVAVITIGEYDRGGRSREVFGRLNTLPLDKDIDDVHKLFNLLNYKIIPNDYRLRWTQDEVKQFLEYDIAEELFEDEEHQILKYDALILIVSSHGNEHNIMTSDYKLIEKTWVHRIISTTYEKSREIPRICLFDACGGNLQQEVSDDDEDDKVDEREESSKQITLKQDIQSEKQWTQHTKNPDYKLVAIHAANKGFMAKTNMNDGSYLISVCCVRKNLFLC